MLISRKVSKFSNDPHDHRCGRRLHRDPSLSANYEAYFLPRTRRMPCPRSRHAGPCIEMRYGGLSGYACVHTANRPNKTPPSSPRPFTAQQSCYDLKVDRLTETGALTAHKPKSHLRDTIGIYRSVFQRINRRRD